MNRTQANEIRATMGLAPLPEVAGKAAQKRKQAANAAKRAAESRELKSKRGSRSK